MHGGSYNARDLASQSSLRNICYTDSRGCKFQVLIPDDAPDEHASFGIRVGPPDLTELNLPEKLEVRLNNQLYDRKMLTKADVRRRRGELIAVWQSVLQVDATVLHNLYEGVGISAS